MAQIPTSAISAAVAVAQRGTIASIQARRTQALKTEHHAEDVAELEEGAITSVGEEESRNHPDEDHDEKQDPDTPKKHLDIKSAGLKSDQSAPNSALDIEA